MHIDNYFAHMVLAEMDASERPLRQPSSTLCAKCRQFDFFDRLGFSVEYNPEDLRSRANHDCDLCTLFWKTAERYQIADRGVNIRFRKVQSLLRIDGVRSPVLTICSSLST